MKKHQLLFLASMSIIIGFSLCFVHYITEKKNHIFKLVESEKFLQEIVLPDVVVEKKEEQKDTPKEMTKEPYVAVLEIPSIRLKQGFYSLNSSLNHVERNITIISPSNFPNVNGGNLILASHSGNSPIAYFKNLYKTKNKDMAYIYYDGVKYTYQMVNRYNVPKVGVVNIQRDKTKTTLTLITCTHEDAQSQTVIIAELVKTEPYTM